MLFKLAVDAAFNLFAYFILLFPTVDSRIPDFIMNGFYDIKVLLAPFNWLFPVDTLFVATNLILLTTLAILTWKMIRWISSILTLGLVK
jgi:hypothetical protein